METYKNCRQLSPPRCSTTTSHHLIKAGVDTLDHGSVFHLTTILMAEKLFKQFKTRKLQLISKLKIRSSHSKQPNI